MKLLFFVLGLFNFHLMASTFTVQEISRFEINSAITPATLDYLEVNLKKTPTQSLILIKLNTPGGLVGTTKEIISLLGQAQRPVAIWVTPTGASAASAGAIIASSSDFIFMGQGTSMGAATPVGLGNDIKESDGKAKITNDLLALIRAQTTMKNRPFKPFEDMVIKASSLTPEEALDAKIIDGIVETQVQLIEKLQQKSFHMNQVEYTLDFHNNLEIKDYRPTLGQSLLSILANPSTAYFLFLIGAALIYFELKAPGGFVAGSIGAIFLVLAGISFQVLPLNWGAFGLIILGIVLFILEVYIISYGVLGIGGAIAIIFGTLFLYDTENTLMNVDYTLMISGYAGILLGIAIFIYFLLKDKKVNSTETKSLIQLDSPAYVLTLPTSTNPFYQIKSHGQIWRAKSSEEFKMNEQVRITHINHKKLTIEIAKLK